ncbi:CsxC family protein [Bacillus sp. AK031]
MSDKYNHHDKSCVEFNKSAHIGECNSAEVDPITAPVIDAVRTINVPVRLATREVTTNMVCNIDFPDHVMEIKDIKKRVEIVQCRLITTPVSELPVFSTPGTMYPLMIKGYVRKNIQYATPCYNSDGQCVSSDIKSLTVRVPFECFTNITLDAPVQLPLTNSRSEFDFFRAQKLGKGFPEKDEFLSSDISQFHQLSTQYYNPLPYCELLSSTMLEWDEATNRETYGHGPVGEGCFDKMVEKLVLRFTVNVMQNQQVPIASVAFPGNGDDNGGL